MILVGPFHVTTDDISVERLLRNYLHIPGDSVTNDQRAPAVLRATYGDAEPLPGGMRLRPWTAFFFAIMLPAAFTLGWRLLFPEIHVW